MLVLALPDNLMFYCVIGITAAFLKGLEDPKVLGRDDTVTVKPFTSLKTQDYFHFLTLARHQLLKIMCWLFSALALAVKNIVVIIFGPPGFFSNFQQISCRIFSEKFSRQISCQKAFV